MDFEKCSDSSCLGKWLLIEVYFFGVGKMAKGRIESNPRFDGREYISAKLPPLQWIRGKSRSLRLGRVTLDVKLKKAVGTGLGILERPSEKIIFFANVRDHRWLPVARLVPGEERAQARGVTRVAIRWIALFGLFVVELFPCVKSSPIPKQKRKNSKNAKERKKHQ
jgi:hypothetical protein